MVGDDNQCQTCSEGTYYDNAECHCNKIANKLNLLIIDVVCSEAMTGCSICLDSETCESCDAPYLLGEDSRCKPCDQGTYYEDGECSCNFSYNYKLINLEKACSLKWCTACSDKTTCTICVSPYEVNSNNKCSSCDVGLYYQNAECLCTFHLEITFP